MPSRSINIVVLGGPLSSKPAPETFGLVRGAALSLTTLGSGGPVEHRVEVRDERIAAEVLALDPGVEVQVTGVLDRVSGGAVVAVDPRRGCDVQILGAPSGAHATRRIDPPAAPERPASRVPATAGLAGLADIADLPDSPDGGEDMGMDEPLPRAAGAPLAPRVAATPPPVQGAPAPGPAPRAQPPQPRVPSGAGAGGARPAPRVPAQVSRPPPSPHAIAQPRPETPPLRPGVQAPARDGFAQQADDSDIPF